MRGIWTHHSILLRCTMLPRDVSYHLIVSNLLILPRLPQGHDQRHLPLHRGSSTSLRCTWAMGMPGCPWMPYKSEHVYHITYIYIYKISRKHNTQSTNIFTLSIVYIVCFNIGTCPYRPFLTGWIQGTTDVAAVDKGHVSRGGSSMSCEVRTASCDNCNANTSKQLLPILVYIRITGSVGSFWIISLEIRNVVQKNEALMLVQQEACHESSNSLAHHGSSICHSSHLKHS